MSLAAARIAMRAIASYSTDGDARRLAQEALEALSDEVVDLGPPSPPRALTNAEKCVRRRLRAKGIEPPPAGRPRHHRDTIATPNDTIATPETTPNGVAALSVVSSSLSSADLLGSISLPESSDLGVTTGSTREGQGSIGSGHPPTLPGIVTPSRATEAGLRDTVATPRSTPSDTIATPSRCRRPTAASTRIPTDWMPPGDIVRWAAEEQGVDALAMVDEFRDYWLSRGDAEAAKADWPRTFKNEVRRLVRLGRAPLLPPPPEPAPVKGDPRQARMVSDVLSGMARAAPLFGKEVDRG